MSVQLTIHASLSEPSSGALPAKIQYAWIIDIGDHNRSGLLLAAAQLRVAGLAVVSSEPATVGGLPGFKVHLETINPKGLTFDILAYGTKDDAFFYSLLNMACNKDWGQFKKLVASFRIDP